MQAQKSDQLDHKRYHNLPRGIPDCEQANTLMVWDFVPTRDDGSCVSLHPNYSNAKVDCKYGERGTDHEVPRTGLGGSSGPGTFKRFAWKGTDAVLKFYISIRARMQTPQSRSSAASASSGNIPPQSWSNAALYIERGSSTAVAEQRRF